jgi:Cys-tRNA(Pro)/Cys-tRNA(Cys) deacylase
VKRTKAIELLSARRVPFEVHEFEATDFTAEEVETKLSIPLCQVFKTLVVEGDKGVYMLAVVPGDRELSPKKLALAARQKKVGLVPIDDLQRLTGYLKGGVSPLCTKKSMPVYLDEHAPSFSFISVSAGLRGLQLFLSAEALIEVTGGTLAEIAE